MISKFNHLWLLFVLPMQLTTSIINAQQTYQLDWGFNINGANASLTIEQGDTVEWTWIDTGQHNVVNTANAVETFDSGLLQGVGTTFSHTFTEIGVNDYECSPHNSNMFGAITVTAPASNDFYIAPNGITCMCPNAAVGDSGDPGNGIVYTKRTRSEITPQNAATTCTSGITDMSSLFNQVIFNEDISSWDVSDVTNMNQMFAESFAFNQPIGFWDVSSVTDMNGMFFMASAFDQPIGDWDVSQVTDMTSMFNEGSFNQPIDNWNVSSVTQMSSMFFFNTSFNQPLNSWDVSNVTNMLGMFENASSFNQDLSNWNVSNVIIMNAMFASASAFDQPIGDWDVSNVTQMSNLFAFASAFNQPIGNWDVSSVIYMDYMFFNASTFDQPINSWDVSNVLGMEAMFSDTVFNQPIGNWDVSSVLSMYNMFNRSNSGGTEFNQDISSWTFNSSVDLTGMLNSSNMSIENYDLLLASMYAQPLTNKEFGDFSLFYCNQQDHDALINEKGWTFDGGQLSPTGIIAPESFLLEADPGACIATNVELGTPDVFGCGTLTVSNDAPTEFPLGVTEVTWTVTDDNGTTEISTQLVEIELISDEAQVCYVSADQNQPQNNRIYITSDPALNGQNVDFHEVLRESPSGDYETIGFIVPPEDSFLDATSDNNTQAYRYRVQTTDVCSQVLTLSEFHKTILLQSSIATDNSVNLAWNPYIGVAFNTYNIYRSANGGNYELLNSVSSTNTSYNDTSANVVDNFYEYYISIEVASCGTDPFQSFELESNREFINPNLSIVQNNWLKNAISIYPNPVSELITISASEGIEVRSMSLYSALGQLVMDVEGAGSIDISMLPSGVYYMAIDTDQGRVNKTLVRK